MSKKKRNKIKSPVSIDKTAAGKRMSLKKVSFFREHGLPLLIISLLALGLYYQSVQYDYVMDDETAQLLGGNPVTVSAGSYRLEYFPEENKKVVVFE